VLAELLPEVPPMLGHGWAVDDEPVGALGPVDARAVVDVLLELVVDAPETADPIPKAIPKAPAAIAARASGLVMKRSISFSL